MAKFISNFKARFQALPADKKKKIIVVSIVAVVALLLISGK